MDRFVPFSVKMKSIFGGALVQVACLVLCFSAIFVFGFGSKIDFAEPFKFSGSLTKAPGAVISIEATGTSEGGGKHSPGRPVLGYRYSFSSGGQPYSGISYSSTTHYVIGESVTVEFDPSKPVNSRILGLRSGIVSFWLFPLALIPPLVGLTLLFFGLRKGLFAVSLFRRGVLAKAKLVRESPTSVTVNNRPVMQLFFEFTARDGRKHEFSTKTSITERLTDDPEENIIYDPDMPERALTLDNLPGRPVFDPQGNISNSSGSVLCLALPVLTAYTYGAGIWWEFFR